MHDVTGSNDGTFGTSRRGAAAEAVRIDPLLNERLAAIAHEMRNSLGAIRNAALFVELREVEPVTQRAGAVIGRQVAQLSRLVEDLMDLTRMRGGHLSLRRELVDLCIVARRAVESVEMEIGRRNQKLTVALPDGPVWLQADPGRLAQVFVNLLDNAAKYTGNGGELRLSVARETGGATVRVRDSGIGLASEVLPHVFEPFMQAQASLSSKGIGMGLALVSCLVELHGGSVSAASAGLGQGSEFTVHLPAAQA